VNGAHPVEARRFHPRPPALLARLPKVPWRPAPDWPVVPAERAGYETLAADLSFWDHELETRFRRLDHQAQRLQNRFLFLSLVLIFGSVAATILGAIQAAVGGGNVWLAVFGSLLSGLLVGVAVLVRDRRSLRGYLNARLKAERIKSEYFLFLAGVGAYASEQDRARRLADRIAEVEAAEGAM
jgi:hypothetical protein